jgi:hypothetical protein
MPSGEDGLSPSTMGDPSGESSDSGGNGEPKLDLESGGSEEGMATGDDGGGPSDPCQEAADLESNQGCEFWAVDLPNVWAGLYGHPSPEQQQFAVVVANTNAQYPAHVTVYRGQDDTWIGETDVAVGDIRTIHLPASSIEPRANTTNGEAYRIVSDLPITAYQFQPLDNTVTVFSNDASLLFPSHVLGNDYTAITGDGISLQTDAGVDGAGAYVTVVGTQDGTQIEIFPAKSLYGGPTQLSLNRGQAATFISSGDTMGVVGAGNLSGSRVAASAPVAVFSGNVATIEPQPGVAGQSCCADHLEHQMLPLTAWGNEYTAAPAPAPGNAAVDNRAGFRITGAYDGTSLIYSGTTPVGAPTVINAYETLRFEANAGFTVRSADPNKSFALTQFLLSNQAIAGVFGQDGDPAMIAVPAAAQFQDRYIFATPAGYGSNFVTIYRRVGTPIELDGVEIAGTWKSAGTIAGAAWEFTHRQLGVGSHSIRSLDEAPFGIIAIGYDEDVSYGYPGGSGFEGLSEPPPPPVD